MADITEPIQVISRELIAIAHQVNAREENIKAFRSHAEDSASSAVLEAKLQGQALIRAKSLVPHGQFEDWLRAHCPNVHPRMARRYMAVAKKWALCQDSNSLRAALMICERSSESEHNNESTKPKTPDFLQALYLFTRATKYVRTHPLDECPEATLTELRRELLPVVRKLFPAMFNA